MRQRFATHPIAALWLVSLVFASACRNAHGTPNHEPIEATRAPEQAAVEGTPQLTAPAANVKLRALARYRVAARVLSRERYYLGWQAKLSPIDLALGWGYMADPAVDRFIDWSQAGRWYFYHWSGNSPFETEAISAESANLHAVPGSVNVRRALLEIQRGDLVQLSGYLVDARDTEHPDVAEWTSSLSRDDRGDGSCELMWIERVLLNGYEYR